MSIYVFVCMYVPKELANCWTDMVLIYNEVSYMSWEGLLLGRVPFKEKSPLKRNIKKCHFVEQLYDLLDFPSY